MEKLESLKLPDAKEIDTSMAKVSLFIGCKEVLGSTGPAMIQVVVLKPPTNAVTAMKIEEYMNKINKNDEWPKGDWLYIESKSEGIRKTEDKNEIESLIGSSRKPKSEIKESIGDTIAKKMEENKEMFVQLEYLLRRTDPRDVRDGHLKIMSQLAQCSTSLWNGEQFKNFMLFTETSPLYNLAFVFICLYGDPEGVPTIIVNNKKLKPLCKFFVDICSDAGLEVALVYTSRHEDDLRVTLYIYNEPSDKMGCTGVVVERADLDSAINCFINSSISAPWRFKHIYVQESIFLELVETLRAKSVGADGAGRVCVGDKTFLLEGERGEGEGEGLPVSAFRSTRELLDLVNTPYLSVWAAETALSHEIALRAPSHTIWINDYASFYGPPRSALSVINIIVTVSRPCPDMKDILAKWSNLQTEERFDVINTAITSSDDVILKQCLPGLREYRANSLLEVTNNTICFGIQKHIGLVGYDKSLVDKISWLIVLKVLLNGNGICNNIDDTLVLTKLLKFGIPITNTDGKVRILVTYRVLMERLKVIRTNYGTIFAN